MNRFFSKGQSLVEVIVALAIAALVAVGLVKATSFGIKNTRFSSNQSQLKSIAQKNINEIIRNQQLNYQQFWEGPIDLPAEFESSTFYDDEDYCLTRKVTDATDGSEKKAKIEIEIFWESKDENVPCSNVGYNHSFKLSTYVAE
ncbi:MAG TPA: prepilin-type N-terminal cleavage/methylation domain-containing protein [Clostridia bacterium]|nr:prepilin-type N-terminal cleavage/methylation domain-containing protein [Clostridia bacterium]